MEIQQRFSSLGLNPESPWTVEVSSTRSSNPVSRLSPHKMNGTNVIFLLKRCERNLKQFLVYLYKFNKNQCEGDHPCGSQLWSFCWQFHRPKALRGGVTVELVSKPGDVRPCPGRTTSRCSGILCHEDITKPF